MLRFLMSCNCFPGSGYVDQGDGSLQESGKYEELLVLQKIDSASMAYKKSN